MIQDNVTWLINLFGRGKAAFIPVSMEGKRFYIASNRAARRFLNSNKIKNICKNHGISNDGENIG